MHLVAYLVDTNVCIRYLKGGNDKLAWHFSRYRPDKIIICSVVRSELFYGAYRSLRIDETLKTLNEFLNLFPDISFNSEAALQFGIVRAELSKKGTPIGPYDLQIAAIAMANNFVLVTHNLNEFSRIPDLILEDWE